MQIMLFLIRGRIHHGRSLGRPRPGCRGDATTTARLRHRARGNRRRPTRDTHPRLTVNLEAPGYDRRRWRVPEAILRQAKVVIGPAGRRDQPDAVLEGPFDEPHDPALKTGK